MRIPILIIGLVVLIVVSSLFAQNWLEHSSETLSKQITVIQKQTSAGNIIEAQQGLNRLKTSWNDIRKGWLLITDHREVDQIETTLVRLESHLKELQYPLVMQELATMKHLVKHIPLKERLSIGNIL